MKECEQCGAKQPRRAKICDCGHLFPQSSPCPNCQHETSLRATACPQCGHPLGSDFSLVSLVETRRSARWSSATWKIAVLLGVTATIAGVLFLREGVMGFGGFFLVSGLIIFVSSNNVLWRDHGR